MGMYTAISLGIELRKDTPDEVTELLRCMVYGNYGGQVGCKIPDHPFFVCTRWQSLFRMDSYYFDYQTNWSFDLDEITRTWHLSGVSNLKNYDNEIDKFLDWINQYIHQAACGHLGWTRYEEDIYPRLIMRTARTDESRIFLVNVQDLFHQLRDAANLMHKLNLGRINDNDWPEIDDWLREYTPDPWL